MTPENAAAVEPQPAGMGEFSRIVGVFFEPGKTFADIAQRPSWIVPMILMILAMIGATVALSQHIGWERIIRQQDEASAQIRNMAPEQRERTMALQMKLAPAMGYTFGIVGVPIYAIVVAAVLLGITSMMSAGLRFKQVFAVVVYGSLPRAISALLMIVVVFLKNPDEFNMRNPTAFNVGAFLDPNYVSKFAYALATSLDLFAIWTILLLATGLKAAAGKKLTFAGALVAVVAPWAVWVLGTAVIAGISG
jgi:hypothetical protein